jgi:exopolysaccharide biosynthesis polyprenyl glycosylphosphotransferase
VGSHRGKREHIDPRAYYVRRFLAAGDATAISIAVVAVSGVDRLSSLHTDLPEAGLLSPLFVLSWLVLAGMAGSYHVDDRRIDCASSEEIFRIVQLVALWIWAVIAFTAVATGGVRLPAVAALGLVAIPSILSCRALARRFARSQRWYRQTALIIGTEEDCWRIQRTLSRHPEYGIEIVETIHPTRWRGDGNLENPSAGGAQSLVSVIDRDGADRVIFASSYEGLDERTGVLRYLAQRGVKVDLVPGDSDVFRSDAELHHIEGLPLLTLPTTVHARYSAALKRTIDLCTAGAVLALCSPALIISALAIKLDSPGPVLFRQRRVGRDGRPFTLLKFRTMVAEAEELKPSLMALNRRKDGMFKIPQDPRITRVGRWLRKYSLDELPQLFNVLSGDMSLVGPRPLIEAESQKVAPRYSARFNVRPGLTGPWQVFGRSDIPLDDMVKLDYTYVTSWSIANDLKLLVRTLSAVGIGKGAY